jgi:hypothetical protein
MSSYERLLAEYLNLDNLGREQLVRVAWVLETF